MYQNIDDICRIKAENRIKFFKKGLYKITKIGYTNFSLKGLLLRPPHNPIANPLGYRISPFMGIFFI